MKARIFVLGGLLALLAVAAEVRDPWNPSQLITPADFAPIVAAKNGPKVLFVGFGVLYRSKHLPGAADAGPASKAEGIEALKKAVAGVPKDREIVIYCGCCPMDPCPNLRPAFKVLTAMGYTRVKVLSIPNNLTKDWIAQGYPVEAGSAAN